MPGCKQQVFGLEICCCQPWQTINNQSRKLVVRASFITSQSELGVIGGGGGWAKLLGKPPLPKGLVLGQISVILGKWFFRHLKEKQASSDAADAGLGVSADPADAGRIVATLCVRL